MNNYTLLVIDMQSQYPAANKISVIDSVLREIEKAKENKCGIIVVEFATEPQYKTWDHTSFSPTHDSIMEAIKGYDRASVVEKYETDGSVYIHNFLEKNWDFNTDFFRVCGVNTDICVAKTINGLFEDYYQDATFIIVKDACNTDEMLPYCKYGKMKVNGIYNPYIAFNPKASIKFA
jgi:nicotinamidase-related amidase